MIDKNKLQCSPANAEKFWDWIQNRGGVAVWKSVNLSNPGVSWSTPRFTEDDPPKPYPKPTWQAENEPSRVITDPADIEVAFDREIKRFGVEIRQSANGLQLKCSDASSRRIEREVARAGMGAYHEFDYGTQEAVIMKPEKVMPLTEWIAEHRTN